MYCITKSHKTASQATLLVTESQELLAMLAGVLRGKMVGHACSGRDALALLPCLDPEVVLLDFAIPDMNVFEVVRQMKSRPRPPRVVIVNRKEGYRHYRNAALQAGADAFIGWLEFSPELLRRIDLLGHERPAPPVHSPNSSERQGIADARTAPLANLAATVVIALCCLVGTAFISWHYWNEESRATQQEENQRRQRLHYWEREAAKSRDNQ